MGTTSACAENTSNASAGTVAERNYLRVRGEYSSARITETLGGELPPRARRILRFPIIVFTVHGTTSACAENTPTGAVDASLLRNYLRVRGEYEIMPASSGFEEELPPRARRIRLMTGWIDFIGGTTSACAENTAMPCHAACLGGNYLRVRGEYVLAIQKSAEKKELPPRARRILPIYVT